MPVLTESASAKPNRNPCFMLDLDKSSCRAHAYLSLCQLVPQQRLVLEEILRKVLGGDAFSKSCLKLLVRPVVFLEPLKVLRHRDAVTLAVPGKENQNAHVSAVAIDVDHRN